MPENTVNQVLRNAGYDTPKEVCGNGFRTMACSALLESGLWTRNFGYGRQLSYAGLRALKDMFGGGHYGTVKTHCDRWQAFVKWYSI